MRIITSLIAILLCFTLSAQEKIEDFEMSYFSSKPFYDVNVSQRENGEISFYIECAPKEGEVLLNISAEEMEDFLKTINDIKSTYLKWKNTAIENNVTDLDKEIEIDNDRYTAAFDYGGWNVDFSVPLNARFKILDGEYLIIIENKNKLTSSDNQYIDSDGFFLVFNSTEEIDNFINSLSIENAKAYFSKKGSKKDLFKQ